MQDDKRDELPRQGDEDLPLSDRIAALEARNRELSAQVSALLGSTSWRITKPVRGVMETLRRRPQRGGRNAPVPRVVPHGSGSPPPPDDRGYVPKSPKAKWVLETKLFDAAFYRQRAGLGDVGDLEAADHYATVGERLGLRPFAGFDPLVYADFNREVAATDMGLLIHYASYGRAEQRPISFEPESCVRPGRRPWDPALKTVLLVCHEVSRTGAPILGWNLARRFNRDHNLVIAIINPDGDLLDIFAEEASFIVGPFSEEHLAWFSMARFGRYLDERFHFDFAIANSMECDAMLVGLAAANVPTLTLVHEFAATLNPPERMTQGLLLSSQVVFDAEAQQTAALELWPGITTRNQHVFPQGMSEIPPDPTPKDRAAASLRRAKVPVYDAVRGKGDCPVVLGLGTVSMRKGTDLFASCAMAVARKIGRGKVRFVWIGHVPKPHPEESFMGWLDDQVKRFDLADGLEFLDAVDDLAGAYRAADMVLLPSRLDPFPNVAIDSAVAGIPVLGFAEANGFADYVAKDERTRFLAIPYLDIDAAASAIVDLARDPDRRHAAGAALQERSRRDFTMEGYVERLAPIVAEAKLIAAQERRDTELLLADETFSREMWLDVHDLFNRDEAIRLHVRKAAAGQEANQYCRRPALGFVPQAYADHHGELDRVPFPNPLAHWIRAGKPEGPWSHPVLVPQPGAPVARPNRLKAALHIHLHYPELAEAMLRILSANAASLDLFVSTTSDEKAEQLRAAVARYDRGSVVVESCPNRGRDLGPMLTRFGAQLQAYDVFGHIHGKRSLALTTVGLSTDLGVRWHEFLMQHLLGDRFPMADLILGRFADSPELGLVFPEDPNLTGWSKDREIARALATRMAPDMEIPHAIDFPIGSMFWARPAALKPLFDLGLGWTDYPEEPVPIDGTMLHAIERLFPVIARHQGFEIMTTHIPGVTR